MGKKDKRIDQYIGKAQDFAKPVLKHLRDLVHKACPEVEENIKWGVPSFEYKGPMCGIASFKQHCIFGLWKARMIQDPKGYLQANAMAGGTAMGNLGRITSMKDLPPDKAIINFVKQACQLNDAGIKDDAKSKPRKELKTPDYMLKAIKSDKKATATFEGFSPSNKRDYIEWVTEAKTEETKAKRLATAIEWMAEGKIRNWKYVRK